MSQVIRMGAAGAVGNPMTAAAALFVALVCQVHAADVGERPLAGAAGKPVQEIRVVQPDKAGPEMRKIAAVFGRQVSERCGALSPRKIPSGSSDDTSSPFRTGIRDQSRQVPGLKLDRLRSDVAVP